jgi:hypothetical protein
MHQRQLQVQTKSGAFSGFAALAPAMFLVERHGTVILA